MKGVILDFSVEEKTGFISGEDGNRYSFTATEWKGTRSANKGDAVNFDSDIDNNAINIYLDESVPNSMPDNLSKAWQFRFEFFDKYGLPVDKNPEFKQGFKSLSLLDRFKVNANWWAFFFGIFYYIYLGIWKKGLVLLAICLPFIAFLPRAPIVPVLFALLANVAYYAKCKRNSDSWNPFEGLITKIKS